jgi:hypothetical protein
MMTRLENKKSLHAQFKFEDPTSSVLRAFFVARHSADNFPGRYGCRPERSNGEIADVRPASDHSIGKPKESRRRRHPGRYVEIRQPAGCKSRFGGAGMDECQERHIRRRYATIQRSLVA